MTVQKRHPDRQKLLTKGKFEINKGISSQAQAYWYLCIYAYKTW